MTSAVNKGGQTSRSSYARRYARRGAFFVHCVNVSTSLLYVLRGQNVSWFPPAQNIASSFPVRLLSACSFTPDVMAVAKTVTGTEVSSRSISFSFVNKDSNSSLTS